MSIGKYKMLAKTPAILVFGDTPPTNRPILNMDNITRKNKPKK